MPSRERLDQGRRRRASSPAQPSATIQFSATPDVEHPVDEEFTGMLVVESLPLESPPASGGGTAPASAPSFEPASTPASDGTAVEIGTTSAATASRNDASAADMQSAGNPACD